MIHVGGARDMERSIGGHGERDGKSDRKKKITKTTVSERGGGQMRGAAKKRREIKIKHKKGNKNECHSVEIRQKSLHFYYFILPLNANIIEKLACINWNIPLSS